MVSGAGDVCPGKGNVWYRGEVSPELGSMFRKLRSTHQENTNRMLKSLWTVFPEPPVSFLCQTRVVKTTEKPGHPACLDSELGLVWSQQPASDGQRTLGLGQN